MGGSVCGPHDPTRILRICAERPTPADFSEIDPQGSWMGTHAKVFDGEGVI